MEMVIVNAKAAIREQEILFSLTQRQLGFVVLEILGVLREVCKASVIDTVDIELSLKIVTLDIYFINRSTRDII